MTHDTELSCLQAQRREAFERKQEAFHAMKASQAQRLEANRALGAAHDARQTAHADMVAVWQRCHDAYVAVGLTNQKQYEALQAMQRCYDAAAKASDKEAAVQFRKEGEQYRAEAFECEQMYRQELATKRAQKLLHSELQAVFMQAKADFDRKYADHELAKAESLEKTKVFNEQKAAYDKLDEQCQERLAVVRQQAQDRREAQRKLAQAAGVPAKYLGAVKVRRLPGGKVNLYFGGLDAPDGLGHGHYVVEPDGLVSYRREPFSKRGDENFTTPQGAPARR